MIPNDEQQLREQVSALALDWATGREPPFTGRSPADFRDVIEAAHVIADEAATGLRRWVDAARRAGLSWSEVGDTLGISKQAAQQRFGGPADSPDTHEGWIVRGNANAFNEMQILDEEGRAGNELMSTGLLSLVFRPTDRLWEYRREIGLAHTVRGPLERAGWTLVSSWFPFQYFKRVVG